VLVGRHGSSPARPAWLRDFVLLRVSWGPDPGRIGHRHVGCSVAISVTTSALSASPFSFASFWLDSGSRWLARVAVDPEKQKPGESAGSLSPGGRAGSRSPGNSYILNTLQEPIRNRQPPERRSLRGARRRLSWGAVTAGNGEDVDARGREASILCRSVQRDAGLTSRKSCPAIASTEGPHLPADHADRAS